MKAWNRKLRLGYLKAVLLCIVKLSQNFKKCNNTIIYVKSQNLEYNQDVPNNRKNWKEILKYTSFTWIYLWKSLNGANMEYETTDHLNLNTGYTMYKFFFVKSTNLLF